MKQKYYRLEGSAFVWVVICFVSRYHLQEQFCFPHPLINYYLIAYEIKSVLHMEISMNLFASVSMSPYLLSDIHFIKMDS